MIKNLLAAASLLCFLTGDPDAKAVPHQGEPTPYTWTAVAAPAQPLNLYRQETYLTWRYPFDIAIPAGTYEVCNAVVDRSHKVGAWSQPATLQLQSGWQLYGGVRNQPASMDEVGLAWKVKCVSVTETAPFLNGSEHIFQTTYETNSPAPFSASCPEPKPLYTYWQRFITPELLTYGGRHQTVAAPPDVVASQFPNQPCDIAYCRVTERGETPLSPCLHVPACTGPASDTQLVSMTITEGHPQGTLGYHLYARFGSKGTWQRLPAPHCLGTPAQPDDWLFQWWDLQPKALRTVSNAPTHSPATAPESRLCLLQTKLAQTAGSIDVVPGTIYQTYCPVIDEWRTGPDTFWRTIGGQGRWQINQNPSLNGYSYWPAIGVYNQYSIWQNLKVTGNGSAGVAFADYQGGKAFGVQFRDCEFVLDSPFPYLSAGALVHDRCSGYYYGHTASELNFTNCKFNAHIPIWIAGTQTANVRFDRTHCYTAYLDRRTSAVYLECPNQVRLAGGFYTECPMGGAIFRSHAWPGKLLVDDIWVDQGFNCLVEQSHNQISFKLRGGKLNCWTQNPTDRPSLLRLIDNPISTSQFVLHDVVPQYNFQGLGMDLQSCHYSLLDVRFEDTAVADVAAIREPTREQEQAATDLVFRGVVPAVPVRPPLGYTVIPNVLSLNSLTNTGTTARIGWKQ